MDAVFKNGSIAATLEGLMDSFEEAKKVWRITIRDP